MTATATITIPGVVACLERFLRPLAATSGDGVEIRQDARGTTVSVCEGRHAATITTRATGSLEPILVDPAVLASVDPSQPLKLYRLTPTTGVVARPCGELVAVTITPGTLPKSARDLADAVEGEIASGMTRAVFEVDPRHLLAVAEALVATGAEKATVTIAPRWNVLAATAETPEITATFLVAGETIEADTPTTGEIDTHAEHDTLAFTIGGGRETRRTTSSPKRRRLPDADEFLEGLPF